MVIAYIYSMHHNHSKELEQQPSLSRKKRILEKIKLQRAFLRIFFFVKNHAFVVIAWPSLSLLFGWNKRN